MQIQALYRQYLKTLLYAFAVLILIYLFDYTFCSVRCNVFETCMWIVNRFNDSVDLTADELVDRNCECCVTCCIDYEGWLQFQNCLYGIVKDPLFELFITTCIVLNTLFLALEHHGMSENVRQALDIGNKVILILWSSKWYILRTKINKFPNTFRCSRQYLL